MRSRSANLTVGSFLFAAFALGACATQPLRPEPTPVAELEADVCATTQSFSALLAANAKNAPPSVRLAHAAQWFDMASAYDKAKSELERCIDPALEATFTAGTEVWEGMPPITATRKFARNDTGSFTDNPRNAWGPTSSLYRIELETVTGPDGVELRLSVH